ncbi:hypothetical protein AB0D66_22585 [Streptomyces sp. NPDC048270]|uniref:hypothetical protein n=1 Tax=Streptomyces sp. NPDC048270 TaxID=3154615 RepID=UPI0033C6247C
MILLTAAMATAAVIAGGIAYSGSGDGAQAAAPAEAAAAEAAAPAAAPARDQDPEPIASAPANESARGMVYDGLEAAPKGDKCVGVYRTGAGHCTHGPDAPPKGVDITKDIAPAVKASAPAADPAKPATDDPASTEGGGRPQDAPAADAAAASAKAPAPAAPAAGGQAVAAGPAGQTVQCDGDGSTGNRVQVVYVHAPGRDRYSEYVASFRKWAADADLIYAASAKETGGVRHIRYVTAADCTPTVLNIELPASALSEFSATNAALAAKGLDRRDRKYMIFADSQVYCGIGTFNGDERPGQANLSNFGPSYGRTDSGCWGGHTAAHELGHNLGAVNNSAPNTSRGAHCTDEFDVMCYSDTPYYPQMRNICTNQASENILDCNHDDYFHTSPKAGSYLATHWNIADNQFLMRAKGGSTGRVCSRSAARARVYARPAAFGAQEASRWAIVSQNQGRWAGGSPRERCAIPSRARPAFGYARDTRSRTSASRPAAAAPAPGSWARTQSAYASDLWGSDGRGTGRFTPPILPGGPDSAATDSHENGLCVLVGIATR